MSNPIYDKNGRQVFEGDLLKIFHFIGARRKKYYMYKIVVKNDNFLLAADPRDLALDKDWKKSARSACLLRCLSSREFEIIAGYGPDKFPNSLYYEDRPKFKLLEKA